MLRYLTPRAEEHAKSRKGDFDGWIYITAKDVQQKFDLVASAIKSEDKEQGKAEGATEASRVVDLTENLYHAHVVGSPDILPELMAFRLRELFTGKKAKIALPDRSHQKTKGGWWESLVVVIPRWGAKLIKRAWR